MLSIKHIGNNLYELNYFNTKIYLCINICTKSRETIEEEIKHMEIDVNKPQAIIPENLVKTSLQFIQAAIHYCLYYSEFNIRNKGLLLSMLVIGEDQIGRAIEMLSKSFKESEKYYVFSINSNCRDLLSENCKPFVLNDFKQECIYYDSLVKNISSLLKRL